MEKNQDRDQLASERTLLAAQRTFSAWIRTGLAGVGGGLAVARALIFKSSDHQAVAHFIGNLLVIWGAGIFLYSFFDYRSTCKRLTREFPSKNSIVFYILITAVLLIVSWLVLWIMPRQ